MKKCINNKDSMYRENPLEELNRLLKLAQEQLGMLDVPTKNRYIRLPDGFTITNDIKFKDINE